MSTIAPTSGSTSGAGGAGATPTTLGKDDFLKLLVTQLQHQDPLQPVDDSQFMAQMAQFSTLEQITNVRDELAKLDGATQLEQAVGLIGKHVTYTASDGSSAGGTVQSVQTQDGNVVLTVDGAEVDPSALLSIAPQGGTTP